MKLAVVAVGGLLLCSLAHAETPEQKPDMLVNGRLRYLGPGLAPARTVRGGDSLSGGGDQPRRKSSPKLRFGLSTATRTRCRRSSDPAT
jgi:hypothetical protein